MKTRPKLKHKIRGTLFASLFGLITVGCLSLIAALIEDGARTLNLELFLTASLIYLLFGAPVALIFGALSSLIIWPIIERLPLHPRQSCPLAGGILGAVLGLALRFAGGQDATSGQFLTLVIGITVFAIAGHIAYRFAKEKDVDISKVF